MSRTLQRGCQAGCDLLPKRSVTVMRAMAARSCLLVTAALVLLGGAGRALAQPNPPGTKRAPPALELIVLGSGGPGAFGRAASCYLLFLDGRPRILVDAGPGSFVRVGEAHLSLDTMDVVLLTHLHVDHAAELPGLVKSRAVSAGRPIHFDVFGPTGRAANADSPAFPSMSRFMALIFGADGAFAYLKDFSAPVSFTVTDLPGSAAETRQPRTIFTGPGLMVSAIGGHHGDAPAVIYRIDYHGRSVVFSGDIDEHGLAALQTIARRADLLVFDTNVLDPPGSPPILYTLHSPPKAIGTVAANSQVGALLLSHLSPDVVEHREAVAASIASHYRGRVTFAADLMRIAP